MKPLLSLLFFFFLSQFSFSQDEGENPLPYVDDKPSEYFVAVDVQAEYPGGMPALGKFLNDNKQYPKYEKDNCIQGKINVQFYVDTIGKVIFAKAIDFVTGGPGLQKEAVRLVSSMPKWKPAIEKGKKVTQQLTLTIDFKLKNCVVVGSDNSDLYETDAVDEMPQYPGGKDSLHSFLKRNLIHPDPVSQYTVYFQFTVKADGTIDNITIIKSMPECSACESESVRLAKLMPLWKPAIKKGTPVNCKYSLQITFKSFF